VTDHCSEERVLLLQEDTELEAKPHGESVQLPRAAPWPVSARGTDERARGARAHLCDLVGRAPGETHPPEQCKLLAGPVSLNEPCKPRGDETALRWGISSSRRETVAVGAGLEVGDEEVVAQEEIGGEEARLEELRMQGGGEVGTGGGGAALQEGRGSCRDGLLLLSVVVVAGGGVEATEFHRGWRGKTWRGRRGAQRHCGGAVGCTRGRGLRVWLERLSLSGSGWHVSTRELP
jgi:hypothetical protein